MARVRLEAIHKTYPGGHAALRGVDLEARDGELLVLVGPSGCGKSTALRVVAGLEAPTAGRVWIGDRDVTTEEPGARDVAMVFQSYALYPHKSVRDNLGFGLRMRRTPRAEIARRVQQAAERLGLDAVLDRRPAQLSGGQRQRVALGRALVREPAAFLLDEPLSNLDAKLRLETRAELARLHRELGATMLYVTHDQEEAMTLGDRVAVLRDGRVEQVAPPLDLYRRPARPFVATFIGSPAMGFLPDALAARLARERGAGGRAVRVGIRPEDLELVPADDPARDATGRVELVERLGRELRVHASLDGARLVASVPGDARTAHVGGELRPEAPVGLRFPRAALHVFDAGSGERIET